MLQLILGDAGSGKSSQIFTELEAYLREGHKAILVVPEQASFEAEKRLLRQVGANLALSVEVLSFTRLCDRIFRALGGIAGAHLDDTARFLLMSVALEEQKEQLSTYRKSVENAAFVAAMCETVSEFKTAGVDPGQLMTVAEKESDPQLFGKLTDFAMVYDAFQTHVEQGYDDPDDHLVRACHLLEETDYFADYGIFIDGFVAFMGGEWKLLEHILKQSPLVAVSLCARTKGKSNVLAAGENTMLRLCETANRALCRVQRKILTDLSRYRAPELAWLARALPDLAPEPFQDQSSAVQLCYKGDFYDELEYVAAQIASLVRRGYRYREIAVIARDLQRYMVPLQTVFTRYEIPFFADLRAEISLFPLISGLMDALDAINSGFDSRPVLSLSKNCVSGIEPVDAAFLENYCFVWNISGKMWIQPFENNPDGMSEKFSEAQKQRLERINSIRKRLITPLLYLQETLSGKIDGLTFAKAAYRWLMNSGALLHLRRSARHMPEEEGKAFLERAAQVWDALINLLDVFGGALGETIMKRDRFIDLLQMSLASIDIGVLPQTLDQVIVGMADRVRPVDLRAVFVIGLNEGEFPRWGGTGGLFSGNERDRLKEIGVDLLATPEQHALFEQYYVYFALTQASERLWLICPERDIAGNGLSPSPVIEQVRRILPNFNDDMEKPLDRATNMGTAFDLLTRSWREQTLEQAALRSFFINSGTETLRTLERIAQNMPFSLNAQTAHQLFGENLLVSTTRVDRFYNCGFSYFCESGLGLHARRRVEFNPLESGSLIHLVLEKLVGRYGGKGLANVEDDILRQEAGQIIQEALSAKITDFEGMPARFKYLFRRLVNTLVRMLRRLAVEFAQSEFEPSAFELPIRQGGIIPPLLLQTTDGTTIEVEGVVDRVDIMEKDGVRYIRVVDYKSGGKKFDLRDVCYGLNLQMLIYLFTICAAKGDEPLENRPAGVLYMPARDALISAARQDDSQTILSKQQALLRMNGLLLDDITCLSGMEPDLKGIFIPAKRKKDGSFDAYSSLATLEEMGVLRGRVEALLIEMAERVHAGAIAAFPATKEDGNSFCGLCEYHTICGHEEEDPVHRMAKLDRKQAMAQLKQAEEKNDAKSAPESIQLHL